MNPKTDLKTRILQLLGSAKYQPLDKVELSKKLGLSSDDRAELRRLLGTMEERGEIARIRKDRFILPEVADLVTGVIQIHQGGGAHILSEKPGQPDLYISGQNTGTALNGDRVVARIMHEGVQERMNRSRTPAAGKAEGRVIRILKRATDTIVGTLQRTKQFFFVIPDDPRFQHDVYVHPPRTGGLGIGPGEVGKPRRGPSRQPAPATKPMLPQVGDKVVVKLDEWTSRHVNPEGEIIEVLGAASAPGVDMLSIIRKYRLPTEFPAAVQREAERVEERVSADELACREDLRAQMIITIDPDDAKDFDDAIHVERTPHGWRLGVHIADVSHYVRTGSALDREAYERGNSVYLVDRVIPMLPEVLSNGVCSLKPHVERLVQSVFIDFSLTGEIKSTRFGRSVIRSAARLTYKQAFAILEGHDSSQVAPAITERVRVAWSLATVLRKNRFKAGSLDLDFPEVKVWLDENKRPVRLEKVENDISHQLIEEFMLIANEVVAKEIKHRQLRSVYRIHESPEPDKLAEYRDFAASYEYRTGDLTQRGEVQKFLTMIQGKPEEYALKLGFLKSLKRATYAVDPLGHYGLAKPNYTHFTSPIRRYADLVVHRVLGQITGGRPGDGRRANQPRRPGAQPPHPGPIRPATVELAAAAEHISTTERTATDAERESVKFKKIEFFQNQLRSRKPEAFKAVIVDVRSYGLLVELPDFLLSGLIHVSALNDDFYMFDPVKLRFVGRASKRVFQIGEKTEVTVARVDVYKQQIDFKIHTETGKIGPAPRPSRHPAETPAQQRSRRPVQGQRPQPARSSTQGPVSQASKRPAQSQGHRTGKRPPQSPAPQGAGRSPQGHSAQPSKGPTQGQPARGGRSRSRRQRSR